jgi:D-beta-D-heptose 7-phosphate kinase/D-beta-D-heptose 1-phosphate adenosyltransferase
LEQIAINERFNMTTYIDLERFERCRVLVLGDLMLDRYLWGDVLRISPEAPVPIFHVRKQSEIPGGAGNVVSNLLGLGASVTVIGVCGEDVQGQRLKYLLRSDKVHSHILVRPERPTITKTRVVSQGQQMLRLDEEEIAPFDESLQAELIELAKANLSSCHAVILSDYGKGLLQSRELAQIIIGLAKKMNIPLIIDPKGTYWDRYRGATCVTPNSKELEAVYGDKIFNDEQLVEAMRAIREKFDFTWLVVTRGSLGMCLMDRNGKATFIPTLARQVFDVSGAGDTVIATLALCLGSGIEFSDGAKLANLAAGIVVGKVGTQPIDLFELKASLETTGVDAPISPVMSKVAPSRAAISRVEAWKSGHQRIVFTNGCFDLLHPGHVHLLNQAKCLGDRLVVAINSDASVRRLKGPKRPILAERDRASLLASLDCVDLVMIFDEDTPEELLRSVTPHILVKGSDYEEEEVLGRAFVESYGGQVKLIPLLNGYSTTIISKKVAESGRA